MVDVARSEAIGGPLAAALRYFAAWNARDPEGIVALFAEGGTYSDPTTGGELTGEAIRAYAAGLFESFPDLSFDILSASATGEGTAVGEWLMRGTNTGPFSGLPPTGLSVALPGVDVIAVDGERIRSVRGFFDSGTMVKQLGLQVVVQPNTLGPVEFGTSVRMNVRQRTRPGAYSITLLETRSDAEASEVEKLSEQVLGQLAAAPGFISTVIGSAGKLMFTISAWETADHPGQFLHAEGAHREAVQRFFGPDFIRGGTTSVWQPHHQNAVWVRCDACGRVVDADQAGGVCQCGATLPEPPPYW